MTISIQRFGFHHRKFPISACCRSTSIIEYARLTRSYNSFSFHLMLRPSTTFDCLLSKSFALACNSQTLSFVSTGSLSICHLQQHTFLHVTLLFRIYPLFKVLPIPFLSSLQCSGDKLLTVFLEHALDPTFYEGLPPHRARKAYPCFEEPRGTFTDSLAHSMFFMMRAMSWSIKITTPRSMQTLSLTSLLLEAFAS